MGNGDRIVEGAYQGVVAEWAARDITCRDQLAAALADYRVRFASHPGVLENPTRRHHAT